MIVDGRALARDILARTKMRAQILVRQPRVVAIIGSETPATKSYLAIKAKRAMDAGCLFETRALGASFTDADAVIIQLPLPGGVDQKEMCDSVPVEKDADVLSRVARGAFERGDTDALLPPVVGAVREILVQSNIALRGKKAVVIGSGWLVGAPVATWLAQQGAMGTVVTKDEGDLGAVLSSADIIISGAGSPHLITRDMIREGVMIIDAGTSESNGALKGDADPACAPICSLFTPVPGGVGPLAVACLFANAVTLAERANSFILPS